MRSLSRAGLASFAGIAALSVLLVASVVSPGHAAGKIKVTWIGHATFEVTSPGGTTLLIDPFILKNPKAPEKMKDLSLYKPDGILVSHSHFDHSADLVAIAKQSGAKVVAASDHGRSLDLDGKQVLRGNPGGKVKVGDVTVHFVPAMHSSDPGGRPVGWVLEFADGRNLYHTGDTGIFGDMELIQELFSPEIILLQVGGGPFNQDPKAAALAIKKYFDPKVIVPMHYGTWPILSPESEVKAVLGGDSRVKIMQPGDSAEF
jgi:L-ascorbate metabolism protein UlaG (beta-lactamase superfamily)